MHGENMKLVLSNVQDHYENFLGINVRETVTFHVIN